MRSVLILTLALDFFISTYPELGRDLLTRGHLFFWGTEESGSELPAQPPVSKEESKPDRSQTQH